MSGKVDEFQALLTEARNTLGPGHGTSLEIEYHWECLRDQERSARESMSHWENLKARADALEAAGSPVRRLIRAHHLQQLRGCGRPDDLDRIVAQTREDLDRESIGQARANLAWVLCDRAVFGRYATGAEQDPQRDLDEAIDLIDAEVKLRRTEQDRWETMIAEVVRVEVLLARVRFDPAAAQEAVDSVLPLVDIDSLPVDYLPPAQLLHAEALGATGSHEDAVGVARRVYAKYGSVHVFDPARPMMTVARHLARDRPDEAVAAAQVAHDQRCRTFGPDSHFALEARDILNALRATPGR